VSEFVVRDFVDVMAASGAAYRFHRADPADLPHRAGNFLFVRLGFDGATVVGCGSSNDLSLSRGLWEAAQAHFAEAVYVRLNIVRGRRSEVLADIAGLHRPAILAEDYDLTAEARALVRSQPQTTAIAV
jgi:hypothetical protein